mmetsp:Transcript_35751/g.72865  ORF Transcript_35751/g.72865 Transcript_35751/m.72865 type:complete len:91 (+) Transcript_35751:85-357(+)
MDCSGIFWCCLCSLSSCFVLCFVLRASFCWPSSSGLLLTFCWPSALFGETKPQLEKPSEKKIKKLSEAERLRQVMSDKTNNLWTGLLCFD